MAQQRKGLETIVRHLIHSIFFTLAKLTGNYHEDRSDDLPSDPSYR